METASTTTLSARNIRIQESEDRAERRWRADDWLEQCARMMSSPEIRQQVGPVPRTHKDPRRFARSVILSEFDGAERMNAHGTRCNNRIPESRELLFRWSCSFRPPSCRTVADVSLSPEEGRTVERSGRGLPSPAVVRLRAILPVDSGDMRQSKFEGVCAVATIPLCLHGKVKLVTEGQSRHREAHLLRFFEGDAHILDEMLHKKSGIEVVVDDSRAEIGK